jgi:hypothetical protein
MFGSPTESSKMKANYGEMTDFEIRLFKAAMKDVLEEEYSRIVNSLGWAIYKYKVANGLIEDKRKRDDDDDDDTVSKKMMKRK